MALTNDEKKTLDSILTQYLYTLDNDTEYSLDYIMENLMPKIQIIVENTSNIKSTLDYSFARVLETNVTLGQYNKNNHYFKKFNNKDFLMNRIVLQKEKEKLYLDEGKRIYYDFIKKELINNGYNVIINNYRMKQCLNDIINVYSQNEWIFNYITNIYEIERIYEIIPHELFVKMPAGFYEIIKNNNNTFNYDLLLDYIMKKRYGKYGLFAKEIFSNCNSDEKQIFLYFFENVCSPQNIFKLTQLDLLEGHCQRIIEDIEDFIYFYNKVVIENNMNYIIDTNRSLTYNIQQLKQIRDKEKNEKLAKQMQRLNFINGYENDKFIIKVPQNQSEKQDEGRMQNNCVGHYYDASILEGSDLIYFIRKKNNPNESYVTCRYHVESKETVEYRLKNNKLVNSIEVVVFIQKIDKMIKEGLG